MRQIVYVMNHQNHMPYLVTSLRSLREHWDGPVSVYAWPENGKHPGALNVMQHIARDTNLDVECIEHMPERYGKNDQFEDKQLVMKSGKWDIGLYLDADTTIHGDLAPLFEAGEEFGFCTTQFNEWKTTGGIIKNRLKRLRDYPKIDQSLIEEVLANEWPSPNGGVFTCKPNSPALAVWHNWTKIAYKVFISDETVLQTLLPKYGPLGQMCMITGGRFNCSARKRYQPEGMKEESIIIKHYHGDCATRWEKCPDGAEEWWAQYQSCLRNNVGNMQEWIELIDYKYLNAFTEHMKELNMINWC